MVAVGSSVGSYEVLGKVGEGAMGSVWLARHPQIGKRVALKVIRPELSNDEDVLTRFFNEARAVTLIGHPNIVEVHDFGQTPDGESFIVMELLEGRTLGQALSDGPMPIDHAVRVAIHITDGLAAAHVRGIIHRDLKPDNVFLVRRSDRSEHVKILDFGLAKLSGPGALQHNTRTGTVLGTAHYMAPEGAEGSRHVDLRADIYGLGCILFQMVTGSVPFPGEGFGEVLVRHVRDAPPLPSRMRSETPPWLEKIILQALAKRPDHRFASMSELGAALRAQDDWGRGVEVEELARNTRLLPVASPVVHVQPMAQAPTELGPVGPVRVAASSVPTVLSGAAPTLIREAPATGRASNAVAAALFIVAGLTLACAVAWRLTHERASQAVAAPAPMPVQPAVAPPAADVEKPVAPAPRAELAQPIPAEVAQPAPAEVARPIPADVRTRPTHAASHKSQQKTKYKLDGSLLAPTW